MDLQKAFETYMKKVELEKKARQRLQAARDRTNKSEEKLRGVKNRLFEYEGKTYLVDWVKNRPWDDKLEIREINNGL